MQLGTHYRNMQTEREIDMDNKALEIVRNYILEHLDKSDATPEFEVYIVWKCKALQNWKYLLAIMIFINTQFSVATGSMDVIFGYFIHMRFIHFVFNMLILVTIFLILYAISLLMILNVWS